MVIANKRGQSSEGNMLIWIIVAIIAAVVVILFFTGGFDVFKNLFKQAPQSLESATQACSLVASPQTRTSYCDQWREVDIAGSTQLVNCQYPAIKSRLDVGEDIICSSIDGTRTNLDYTQKGEEYCQLLFKSGKVTENTKANDKLCSSMSCASDYQGTISSDGKCATGKAISKGFSESKDGKVCCIAN